MRRLPFALAAGFALTACGSGASGQAAPQPVTQPNVGAATNTAKSGPDCDATIKEGAPATASLVVSGCVSGSKSVVVKTQRCRDGRTYLIYGTRFKGMLGGVWHDVGPGHEAVAARFAKC